MRKILLVVLTTVFLLGDSGVSAGESGYAWLIKPKYEDAECFKGNSWNVKKGDLWGRVDSADNAVGEFRPGNRDIWRSSLQSSLFFEKTPSGDWGLYSEQENRFVSVDLLQTLSLNLLGMEPLLIPFRGEKGKYGFMDLSGDIRIPAVYDGPAVFFRGRAVVKVIEDRGADYQGWRFAVLRGMIDTEGEWLVPPEFEDILYPADLDDDPIETIVAVKRNGLWGLIALQ